MEKHDGESTAEQNDDNRISYNPKNVAIILFVAIKSNQDEKNSWLK